MYQYLANERVRRVIEEAGLSDKVVFLVTTEPWSSDDDTVQSEPYNFGEGFDENYFLKTGYKGEVSLSLIYLDSEKPEDLDYEEEEDYTIQLEREMYSKIIFPLHEELRFELGEYVDRNGNEKFGPYKDVYVKIYNVDDYDRAIIVDLFRKYPLTEREQKPNLGMADIFSPRFRARAETQGFHYLDIFGGTPVIDYNNDKLDYDIKRAIEEGWYQPGN